MEHHRISRRLFCTGAAACAAALLGCNKGTDCDDPAQISRASRELRQELAYAPRTPRRGQRCDNCAHYRSPAAKGACGGCNLFSGPVTAGGWCKEWVAGKPAH